MYKYCVGHTELIFFSVEWKSALPPTNFHTDSITVNTTSAEVSAVVEWTANPHSMNCYYSLYWMSTTTGDNGFRKLHVSCCTTSKLPALKNVICVVIFSTVPVLFNSKLRVIAMPNAIAFGIENESESDIQVKLALKYFFSSLLTLFLLLKYIHVHSLICLAVPYQPSLCFDSMYVNVL